MLVDTNVLVRLVTKHPPGMFEGARRYLQEAERRGEKLAVHPVHVTEALFVLEGKVYSLQPEQAASELRQLLTMEVLEVDDGPAVLEALRRYPLSGLDFPDVLIAEIARLRGATVLSFDRKIARLGVRVVDPAEYGTRQQD